MSAERQVPGGPFVNEVGTAQRQVPGGPFVNETVAVGGSNTISVPAGSLVLTSYAPTVTATDHKTIAVPAGSLVLTAYAPTVTAPDNKTVSVPAGSLVLTGFAPTVTATANWTIAVPAGSLTLTGYAPSVSTGNETTINIPAGTLTLTGYAPTVTASTNYVSVPAGSLVLTAFAPSVSNGEVTRRVYKLNEQPQFGSDLNLMRIAVTEHIRNHAREINRLKAGYFSPRLNTAKAAPTTGTWARGDYVANEEPAETGTGGSKYFVEGWTCLVSGTPGTWVERRIFTGN